MKVVFPRIPNLDERIRRENSRADVAVPVDALAGSGHPKAIRRFSPLGRVRKPTEAELSILGVLWHYGPSTVGQVRDAIDASNKTSKTTGYTTVLKLMQIMIGKGLVTRDEMLRPHVYQARLPKEETQRLLIADLLDRAFEGSTSGLVILALSSQRATLSELLEIREILKDHERVWNSVPRILGRD